MEFSEEEQRLYLPKCGYYQISSQVLFQYHPDNNDDKEQTHSSYHGVEIVSNCGSHGSQYLYSHANLEKKRFAKASTYISKIAKICEDGSMSIFIPTAKNRCCVDGSESHFSAVLIQETPCS